MNVKNAFQLGQKALSFWYLVPVVGSLIIIIYFMIPQYQQEVADTKHADFTVRIPETSWTVYYDDISAGVSCEELDQKCPAHPRFEPLWRGQPRIGWDHADTIKRRQDFAYWIGIKISVADQLRANEAGADRFLVGMFYGKFEIYLNGKSVFVGGNEHARDPVILPVQFPENPEDPVYVAVRIVNDMNEPFPDTLFFTGIGTDAQMRSHLRKDAMTYYVEKAAAAGFNLGLGIFLLALFLASPRKQELAAFASFAFVHAAVQAAEIPFMWDRMGMFTWHQLNFVVVWYEAVFVLMVGIALARIRSTATMVGCAVLVVVPWFIFWVPATSIDIYYFVQSELAPVANACYFLAAAICLAQATNVYLRYYEVLQDRARMAKLVIVALGLVFMGSLHLYGERIYVDQRILNGFLLAILSSAVVHEYQRQELQFRKTLVSKYHLRAKLPELLKVVLVGIDIKGSEKIDHNNVQRTIDSLGQAILRKGGELIQTEGNAILFALPYQGETPPIETAVHIISKCATLARAQEVAMNFRAAMSVGEIRPIWQEFLAQKRPAWVSAGEKNVFVTVARLLEAEKKVVHEPKTTLIGDSTFPVNMATTIGQVEIKHGRIISYELFEFPTPDQRSAA